MRSAVTCMRRELISPQLAFLGTWVFVLVSAFAWSQGPTDPRTPIQHVVVIFQENQSFDHYFATYPNAANLAEERPFHAILGTPTVNGLSETLRTHNPNSEQPWRISRSRAVSVIAACDNDHSYTAEQNAYDRGLADKFVEFTGSRDKGCPKNFVMGYVDGNTVTAVWNYAQHFVLNDNFFGTTFGPS